MGSNNRIIPTYSSLSLRLTQLSVFRTPRWYLFFSLSTCLPVLQFVSACLSMSDASTSGKSKLGVAVRVQGDWED